MKKTILILLLCLFAALPIVSAEKVVTYGGNTYAIDSFEISASGETRADWAAESVAKGDARYQAGDLSGALAKYSEALAYDNECGAAYAGKAAVYQEQKDYAAAAAEYTLAIGCRSLVIGDYIGRSACRYFLGAYEDAIADTDVAITLEPTAGSAYLIKATCQERLGRKEDAADTYAAILTSVSAEDANAHEIARDRLAVLRPEKT